MPDRESVEPDAYGEVWDDAATAKAIAEGRKRINEGRGTWIDEAYVPLWEDYLDPSKSPFHLFFAKSLRKDESDA